MTDDFSDPFVGRSADGLSISPAEIKQDPYNEADPFVGRSNDPLGGGDEGSSTFGAFTRGAVRGAVPAAGGLAGAGAGAQLGGAAGLTLGPFGGLLGALGGGIVGGFGGSFLADKAQSYALSKAPDTWVEALGQDDRQLRLDQEQHPYASFLGGLAPFALTMSPMGEAGAGAKALKALGPNATAMQRIMANPVTARVFGGAMMGGMELGQEYAEGNVDLNKVAIATGFGVIFNRPNEFGKTIEGSIPRAFGVKPHGEPTFANADASNVAGPGVNEAVSMGSQQRAPAAEAAAIANEIEETKTVGPTPTPNPAATARETHPEAFAEYNDLTAQKAELEKAAENALNPEPIKQHIAAVEAQIQKIAPEISAAAKRSAEMTGAETVAPTPVEPPKPHDLDFIVQDVKRQFMAAGRPEDEAEALGHLAADRLAQRSEAFEGAIGTPEEIYRREGLEIRGADGKPRKVGGSEPPGPPDAGLIKPVPDPLPPPGVTPPAPVVAPDEAKAPEAATPPRKSSDAMADVWRAQDKAKAEREEAYANAKRHLDATGDKAAAEKMLEDSFAKINADDKEAGDRHTAEALALLEKELGPKPTALDVRQMSKDAEAVYKQPPAPEPEPAPQPTPEPAAPAAADPREAFVAAVKQRLLGGAQPFKTILEARALAKQHGLEFGEDEVANKTVDELVERAVVESARDIVARHRAEGRSPQETFAEMRRLYDNQPNLSTRTSKSIAEQAYSTPAPLAYVASRLAEIDENTHVLEPTAGNGMLLMEANPLHARVNELNRARGAALEAQGFKPTVADAADPQTFAHDAGRMDAVIANPPFGAVREGGESKVFKVDGFNTTQIDHAIALNALKAMKSDGRAVLIVGGVQAIDEAERVKGYTAKNKRRFWHELSTKYKVVDAFTVDGDLYQKQGAGFPVDVFVIEGRGKSDRKPLTAEPPPLLKTWDEVGARLNVPDRARQPGPSVPRPDLVEGVSTAGGNAEPAGGNAVGGGTAAGSQSAPGFPAEQPRPEALDPGVSSAEPGPDGPVNPLDEGARQPPGGPGDVPGPHPESVSDGGGPVEPSPVARPKAAEVKEGQTPYEPASREGTKLNTLLPANLRDGTNEALDRLQRQHGDIDDYVAKALGRDRSELGKYFSAEQIDAIALGISNIQKGEGFIIGDQTGIGKGRVVAAMIAYARRHGLVPVFVTQYPELYGAMWKDLHDIGWHQQLGREIKMMMTNSGTSVPLDGEALKWTAERDEAKAEGLPIPPKRGAFSAPQTAEKARARMLALIRGDVTAETPDVVMTTYSQMNSVKGAETDRRRFMREISPKAFLIMDEAHNAGGTSAEGDDRFKDDEGAPPRSELFREAVGSAHSVMYSSATYAKSPQVMTLYSKTDMAKAVQNPAELPELIRKGGVPLQQVVASMLARAGQYIRRERSFDGVSYDHENVPVSEKAYGEFTEGLGAVFRFDEGFAAERDRLAQAEAVKHGGGKQKDSAVGGASASSTAFSSVMHNVIAQMIMALKAEKAGQRAVEALRAGEKPVIALSKTNAAFIEQFMNEEGLNVGDKANISFADILKRYLERTRRFTIKLGNDEIIRVTIPLEVMSAKALFEYRQAEKVLRNISLGDLPVSPIDTIRHEISKAGYSVREITGRKTMLDYTGDEPVIVRRPASEMESTGKTLSREAFNEGKLDALILNQSGSTGISLHASAEFKDQRRRRMIIAEADPNIDTHMQMLGRVHRTGQVIAPAYTHLSADIPAEVRPTAVLMRKMASLNANTTGAKKSRFTSEAVDFLNKYGDQVSKQVMAENPEISALLGDPVNLDPDKPAEGAAAKVTGRLTLLKPDEQQWLLDRITDAYKTKIEQLDAEGGNDLEAKALDLQARVLESSTLKPPTGPSPFQGAVNLDKVSVKSQGRAFSPEEVAETVGKALKVEPGDGAFGEQMARLERAGKARQADVIERARKATVERLKLEQSTLKDPDAKEKAKTKTEDAYRKFKGIADFAHPGAVVNLTLAGEETPAIVIGFKQDKYANNPMALWTWDVTFALPDGRRSIGVPLSRLTIGEAKEGAVAIARNHGTSHEDLARMFEDARKSGRENRYMLSGNMLAAFVAAPGQIITHTMEDGSTRPAIMLRRSFDPTKYMQERAVRFANGEHVMKFLNQIPDGEIKSTDGLITVRKVTGGFEFEMPSNREGKKYFADRTVRDVFDSWLKRGSVMRATLAPARAQNLIDALMKVDATFETRSNQDLANKLRPEAPQTQFQTGEPSLEQRIQWAMIDSAGVNRRVFLRDIRSMFYDVPREELDAALRNLHEDPDNGFHLSGTDNPRELERAPDLKAATLPYKGEDMIAAWQTKELEQEKMGSWTPRPGGPSLIKIFKEANATTGVHELGHEWLYRLSQDAAHPQAPQRMREIWDIAKRELGIGDDGKISTRAHEKFADGYMRWLYEGVAPTRMLKRVFEAFREWMLPLYDKMKGLQTEISPGLRQVFEYMHTTRDRDTVIAPHEARGPSLADIHATDATETPKADAEAGADRVREERKRFEAEAPKDIADESAKAEAEAEQAAAGGTADAGGEAGGGGGGLPEVDHGGGKAGAEPGGGGVGEPSGEERPSGNATAGESGGAAAGTNGRSESGDLVRGHPLAAGPAPRIGNGESEFVDKAGNFKRANINVPNDVWAAIKARAELHDNFEGDRRAPSPWPLTQKLAQAMGRSGAEDLVDGWVRGQAFNAEQVYGLVDLLQDQAMEIGRLAKLNDRSDEGVLRFAMEEARLDMVLRTVMGATAEAGRALNIFRMMQSRFKNIDEVIRAATGRTMFQKKMEMKMAAQLETPEAISYLVGMSQRHSFGRMLLEYWINGLISGPATHVTYTIGNSILAMERGGIETPVAAGLAALRGGGAGSVRLGEVGARGAGLARGLAPALQATGEALRTGLTGRLPGQDALRSLPFQEKGAPVVSGPMLNEAATWAEARASLFGAARGAVDGLIGIGKVLNATPPGEKTAQVMWSPMRATPDIRVRGGIIPTGALVTLPSRGVAAIHTFFRAMNYAMEKNAFIYRQAADEGLTGTLRYQRMAQLSLNTPENIMTASTRGATDMTLMGPAGEFVSRLSRLTNWAPNLPLLGETPILKFIDPFVHIAANVIDQSIVQRSPAGLLSAQIRADLMSKDLAVRDMARARMIVGTAMMVGFGALASRGLISGSGPSDRNKAAVWRLAGNQAHSIRIGDVWYATNRLGPMGMILGMSADLYDVARTAASGDYLEAAAYLHHAVVQNVLDESFMRGPADLIQAVEDPGRYGENYIRNFASSFLPMSVAMAQIDRASDPYSRQARTVVDALKQKIPGESETLFPKRDIWGEPIPNHDALVSAGLTAIYEQRMSTDPVNIALANMGMGIGQPDRSIRLVKLTDQQYDDFQRIAGRVAKMRLNVIVQSPDWRNWPVGVRSDVISEVISQSRESARGLMMMKYPSIMAEATRMKRQKFQGLQ